MEDAQVGDRDLQTITGINKCTRTTAMAVLVIWVVLWPPVQRGAQNPELAKVDPKSPPELAEEPAASSEPIQPEPRQSEPSPRTRAGFDHPARIVLNAHQ